LEKFSNNQNTISSLLTVQEGCDKFCNYCVVPYTRGPEKSRTFKQIISEANNLVDNGAKEIVLLGQNVNAYNFSEINKNFTLSSLIRRLNDIKHLKRIRYMTSHPKDMSEDLINCYKDCEKLMPFLHLPVQSGSDKILKSMNRKHDIRYYLSIIKKLKNINKDIKISSDFIIGYPGETKKDFEDTIDLIKNVGFVNSYSFIFSPRHGTPVAEKQPNNLLESKKRLKKLQNTLENIQLVDSQMYVQKYCQVLVENKLAGKEKYFGRTKFMSPVKFESDNCQPGDLIDVKITSFNQNSLFGFHKSNKVKAA
jgi:tRNA-2-methylthio-N6-dimethylallyladenosine synthase